MCSDLPTICGSFQRLCVLICFLYIWTEKQDISSQYSLTKKPLTALLNVFKISSLCNILSLYTYSRFCECNGSSLIIT